MPKRTGKRVADHGCKRCGGHGFYVVGYVRGTPLYHKCDCWHWIEFGKKKKKASEVRDGKAAAAGGE